MKGRAHVYRRGHVNTDEIIPARYLTSNKDEELANHAMEDIDKEFVNKVKKGDFIVAADDFGCGSSREHAVWALRGAGIRAIIANTFARIFYRNCINNGLLAIECPKIAEETDYGDELEINLIEGKITNITKNNTYLFVPISEFANEMINSGGLINYIKKGETR